MKFQKILGLVLAIVMVSCSAFALADDTLQTILNSKTTQAFTQDTISDEDLNKILEAGLSATSAINQQPWFFAVVTNKDVMSEIAGSGFGGGAAPQNDAVPEGNKPAELPEGTDQQSLPEGIDPQNIPNGVPAAGSGSAKASVGDSPVAIIIYLDESGMGSSAFDCGLACQNMFIAANALGYGAKIVSSPTMTLNGEKHDEICDKLGVDTSYKAVAVLLLGVPDDTVDGATGATTRSTIDEKVSFIK